MTRPPRLVALDLGGVLADIDRSALARALGRSQAEVDAAFFADDRHQRLATGRLAPDAYLSEAGRALAPLDDPGARGVKNAWEAMVSVRPGAKELVEAVGERSAVTLWSNTDPLHYAVLLACLPLTADGAEARALSFEVGAVKPERAFFTAALARARRPPQTVAFLDDRQENVDAARALGIEARRVSTLDEAWSSLRALGAVTV